MRLLEVVRAKKTRPDVLATAHVAGATHRQDRRGLRRVRWLHRQSHDQSVLAAGAAAAGGGRVAAAGGSRPSRSSASRWARSACRISRATTSAGTSASVTTPSIRKLRHMRIADRVCELGRFGQKTGLGWYRYEAGKRDAIPDPVVDQIIDEERKALKIDAAQDPRRRDRRPAAVCAGERRRAHPRGRHRAARLRHRRGVPHRLRISRCSAAARCSTPAASGSGRWCGACGSSRRTRMPSRDSGSRRSCIAQLAAAGRELRRRASSAKDASQSQKGGSAVVDAVIVSTARTALAKSWRGAFNLTHGATLGGHVVKAAMRARAARSRRRSKTCSWAAPIPRAPPASTSRGRSRCAPDVRSPPPA